MTTPKTPGPTRLDELMEELARRDCILGPDDMRTRTLLELYTDQIRDDEAAKAQAVVEAGEKLITICKEIQSPAFMRYEEIRVDACLQRMSDAFASLADALRRWGDAT